MSSSLLSYVSSSLVRITLNYPSKKSLSLLCLLRTSSKLFSNSSILFFRVSISYLPSLIFQSWSSNFCFSCFMKSSQQLCSDACCFFNYSIWLSRSSVAALCNFALFSSLSSKSLIIIILLWIQFYMSFNSCCNYAIRLSFSFKSCCNWLINLLVFSFSNKIILSKSFKFIS